MLSIPLFDEGTELVGKFAQIVQVGGRQCSFRTSMVSVDENAAMDYPTFKKIAAELSATILTRFVAEEQTQESLF